MLGDVYSFIDSLHQHVRTVCRHVASNFLYICSRGKRGLVEYQSGIILGCYDFRQLISGPLCANVVSNEEFVVVCLILNKNQILVISFNSESSQGDKPCNIIHMYPL